MRSLVLALQLVVPAIFLSGCALFLRAGRVESRPHGVAAIFPQQDGSMQADNSWTKNMTPVFEIPATGATATISIRLSPHVTLASNHLPTDCGLMVLGLDDLHGISMPVTYEPEGFDEIFRGTIAVADLAAIPRDQRLKLTLCEQRYVFSSTAVRAAIDSRAVPR